MTQGFTPEQHQLRTVVRSFLTDRSPESEVRRLMETEGGFDPAVWAQLGQELGLCGLAVPEAFGGAGYSFVEVGVVLEELGRVLACLPYLSSVVMAQSLLIASRDDDAGKRYLPGLASGEVRGAVALTEASGRLDEAGITTTATFDQRAGWRISGRKLFVLDGHTAHELFVVARTERGVSVFGVTADAPGLTTAPMRTMDATRKQAQVTLDSTPARLIGEDGGGWAPVTRMLLVSAIAVAAESVGGAEMTLQAAVEYAKIRVQFGRPIGSYQAIKHKCADMLLSVESAKAAVHDALRATARDRPDLPIVASATKVYCAEAYVHVATESIQVHGGIGYTWEHPAHLYFKRARSNQLLFGNANHHRELLAQHVCA